jgi:membrane-bound lytic murein transglycosylase D
MTTYFRLKKVRMIRLTILILFSVCFLFVFPAYALEVENPVTAANHISADPPGDSAVPVISTLSEDKIKGGPKIVSDYSSNEVALRAVERNVNLFSENIKEKFSVWLSRSGQYLELMKNILKEKNVPEEIVFLPLIESGFNPYAYSPARAAGYWQFIASTAKKYGLAITWWKDERRDPVKSTVAAANYLNDLYQMFGSWNLAMAAYNAGEGKILKALNRTKTDDYWSLLGTNQIKRETKDYVPKFIAASLIANNPETYGFDNLEYHQPFNYETVTLTSPVDLDVVADCAGTSVDVIKELNPELRRWCTPPDAREYSLRIPEGKKDIFFENLSQIPEEKRFTVDIYTAIKGDTLKGISRRSGIPVQAILDLNDLEKIIPLNKGAKIYLPPRGKFVLDREDRAMVKKVSFKQKKNRRALKKASLGHKKRPVSARSKKT